MGVMQRSIGRVATAALLAGAIAIGGTQAASAAAPWLPPADLAAPETSPQAPDVAVARDGTTVAVFRRSEGGFALAYAAVRPPGGSFGPPTLLSATGADVSDLRVAVDRQGNATAVWRRGAVVQSAFRPNGSTWRAAQSLSSGTAATPSVATGDGGAAAVVWSASNVVQVAVRQAGSEAFGLPATPVSTASGTIHGIPRVAMDAAGDLTVLWNREYDVGGGTLRRVMESIAKPATGAYEPVRTLSSTSAGGAGSAFTLPPPISITIVTAVYDLVMTPEGRAFAVWDADDGSNPQKIEYTERTTTGSWAARKTLSAPATASTEPRVAADEVGGTVVAWSASGAVVSAVRPDLATAFSAPKALSGAGASPTSSVIAAGPNGEAVILWQATPGSDPSVFAARRRAGTSEFGENVEVVRGKGGPGTPAAPSASFSALRVRLDDQGNGVASWARFSNDGSASSYTAQVASYDPVAPTFSALSVPGSGTAGAGVAFSAAPGDRVGPTTVSWDFGDGQSGSGAAVGHAYAAAGGYAVKVAATDAAGNRTETTRTIQVAAAPGPPPPPPPPPGAVDADGDGVPAGADCADGDAKIRPGATEIPGNAVDENCDGRADALASPTVGGSVALGVTRLRSGRTRIRTLTVRGLVKGDAVALACATRARGCRKAATKKATVTKGTTLSFTKAVKGMSLAPKATLTVKVTRRNAGSRTVVLTMVRGRSPSRLVRCQAPGAKRATAC
jgi:PKD repeat protein